MSEPDNNASKMVRLTPEQFERLSRETFKDNYLGLPLIYRDLEDAPPESLRCPICKRWGCMSDHGY